MKLISFLSIIFVVIFSSHCMQPSVARCKELERETGNLFIAILLTNPEFTNEDIGAMILLNEKKIKDCER